MYNKILNWIYRNNEDFYINRKAINDPLKISLYNGMMIYLKVLQVMAMTHKKSYTPRKLMNEEKEVEIPWIDKVLDNIKDFKENAKSKTNKSEESETDKV